MLQLLKEFRPALTFLGKFVAVYLVGNVLYGVYVESFDDRPDGITRVVTAQSAKVLNWLGHEVQFNDVPGSPKVAMQEEGQTVINVFEGCNGINVMIVFVAFLAAFGGSIRKMAIFLISGLAIIYLFNLVRVVYLYKLAYNGSHSFYYYHKYFFTASLYLIVFGLWALWVLRFNKTLDAKGTG